MKFGNLLKKELSELITKQAIVMLVFVVILYVFMGSIMGKAMSEGDSDETSADGGITICCQDTSEFTKSVLAKIEADGTKINYVELQSDDFDAELDRLDMKKLVIIPADFGSNIIENGTVGNLKLVRKLSMGGISSTFSSISDTGAVEIIQSAASDTILLDKFGVTSDDITKIKAQTGMVEYTTFNGRTAQVSASSLQGMIMAQSMIAPFVIFFLLIMASSMIMSAISTEKIDKTLETLLSTPVSRVTVLMAKMVAALISALLNAGVMMIGFAFYIVGMIGGISNITDIASTGLSEEAAGEIANSGVSVVQAMNDLGLTLSIGSYVLFGLQLFATVAIGLSISLILGAMATDAKSVQTLTMPVMLMVMIPFFVCMFLDLNAASLPIKIIMYIIPFTHAFTALTNLAAGNTLIVVLGLVYQIVFFAVCMFVAVKMFTTDRLFTIGVGAEKTVKKGGLFANLKK